MKNKACGGEEAMMIMGGQNHIWVTEFSDMALQSFYSDFVRMEADPHIQVIPIIVSSYGGEIHVLLAMRDLIKSSPKPVSTIALGKAQSCGAMLLAAGSKGLRFAGKDCDILLHQASGAGFGKSADVQASAKHLEFLNKLVLQNLAKDTGRSLEEMEKIVNNKSNVDVNLTAKQAKKLGLIDFIDIPRILPAIQNNALMSVPSFESQALPITKKGQK